MRDESPFPPRCCHTPFALTSTVMLLDFDVVESFLEKSIELKTKDRTYCHKSAPLLSLWMILTNAQIAPNVPNARRQPTPYAALQSTTETGQKILH